jgi:nucleoside 2-deoxyribosyltransferase
MSDEMAKLRLYIASPLFNDAERILNREIAKQLDPFFKVYLPQEDGGLMTDMIDQGMTPASAARLVFEEDLRAIDRCDLLLIVLDGRVIDEGAVFELGYASAKNKPCYGFKSDSRQLLPSGNNPMIAGALLQIFTDLDQLARWACSYGQKPVPHFRAVKERKIHA